eukprot:GEMP01086160.1.p1 GENE.GEMP01086160.1~~GEMP01086160.1.p1  ORF type:complete len:125 (+),score=15.16 GEMP01086160.1:125-499(+)
MIRHWWLCVCVCARLGAHLPNPVNLTRNTLIQHKGFASWRELRHARHPAEMAIQLGSGLHYRNKRFRNMRRIHEAAKNAHPCRHLHKAQRIQCELQWDASLLSEKTADGVKGPRTQVSVLLDHD